MSTVTITDPAVAAAYVAFEIAEGNLYTPIMVLESEFSGEANASDALEHALEALRAHDGNPVRQDVAARCDMDLDNIAIDDLVLPDTDGYVTVVVALTVSEFTFDRIETAFVLRYVRQAIDVFEEAAGRSVHRVIYVISQED